MCRLFLCYDNYHFFLTIPKISLTHTSDKSTKLLKGYVAKN